jgi:putative membrane protein
MGRRRDDVDPLTLPAIATSLLYAVLGMVTLGIGFWIFDRITPYHLWLEVVDRQNTAVAIVVAGITIAFALIVAAAIH